MKKYIKTFTAVILVAAFLLASVSGAFDIGSTKANASTITATVTGDIVNLRSGAGTSYDVITRLSKGSTVTVLDTSNSEWYKVTTASGDTGYMNSQYLSLSYSGSSGTGKTTDYVYLRTGPSIGYSSIITLASPGTSIIIIDTSNPDWYYVKIPNVSYGYMSSTYISVDSSSSQPDPTPAPQDTPVGTGTTTDYLNLRSGAGTSSSIITTLSTGTSVTLLDTGNSGWYKVKTSAGTVGYVSSTYLSVTFYSSNPGTPSDSSIGTGVTTDYLNLRSGAGTSYSKITTLSVGETVTVLSSSGGWYNVKTSSGATGYVCADYLTVTLNQQTPPPAPDPTISLETDNATVAVGQAYSLKADVQNNGSTVPSCSSSNDAVAKVSYTDTASGVYTYSVVGTGNGTANITISIGSISKTFSIKVYGYVITTTGLNFRTGPSTDYNIIELLPTGTCLTILDASNTSWVKVKSIDGDIGYVCGDFITYTDGNTGAITLSSTSVSISQGKTVGVKATTESSSSVIVWKSDDETIANVSNGFIYAVKPGSTTIRATDPAGNNSVACSVTVTPGEAVAFAYATPNIVSVGNNMQAVAITDTSKQEVRFTVYGSDGSTTNYDSSSFTNESNAATGSLNENDTRVWKSNIQLSTAGEYTIRAYSYDGSSWSTEYKEFTAFVVSTTDNTTTAFGKRRASDEVLNIIASFEGYRAGVYADSLAYGIPTIGYGYVISTGEQFYNNLTQSEAWALLCSTVNNKTYTTEVNRFVTNNNIKISQSQFDALVSFSYNVGAGYWNSNDEFTLRDMMLNSIDISTLDFSGSGYGATMIESANLYTNIGDSTPATSASTGTSVTVVNAKHTETSTENSTWYKVRLSDGNEYWVRNVYVSINNKSGMTLDLRYVDAVAFGSEMLTWHKAGGVCVPGLLYRRLAEAKMFSFANYSEASPSSSKYRVNTYGYFYPSCLAYCEVKP